LLIIPVYDADYGQCAYDTTVGLLSQGEEYEDY